MESVSLEFAASRRKNEPSNMDTNFFSSLSEVRKRAVAVETLTVSGGQRK